MSITEETRQIHADRLRRHFTMLGVPQRRADEFPEGSRGWVRYSRCGQWNADAPDPELFFPVEPDSRATYQAQQFCIECPVRGLCDVEATRFRYQGVWAGIHRNDHGAVSLVCDTTGCLRYRVHGQSFCRACSRKAAEVRARRDAEQAERAAADRAFLAALNSGPGKVAAAV